MSDIQPSFYQWRKKVSAALAIDPARVTLVYTGSDGRKLSIEPEELQTPQPGTYAARYVGGDGQWQEIAADFDLPTERPRRAPEDAFLARYERMADDLEFARVSAEKRAQAAEAEKLATLELVSSQYRRILELEEEVSALKNHASPFLDNDTLNLVLEAVQQWTGAAQMKGQIALLLRALEEDPKTAEKLLRRVPEILSSLVQAVYPSEGQ
ncbi:MAG: hypothetical protein IPK82_20140 [Polyangiaceae bacterium]|nr:hypothetical protein [Polyangiaceae bacterium]